MELSGRTAIVTGASRGIGKAIALMLAEAGADIAFSHLDDPNAAATANEITALGRRVMCRSFDVADLEQIEAFVGETQCFFGTPDILVNNAGGNLDGTFGDLTEDAYDRQMDINLKSTVFMTRAVYSSMIVRGSGRIINIASQLGLRGEYGMVIYSAAKAGVIGFTRALAREATAHGVLVNSIAPGPVDTAATQRVAPAINAALRERLLTKRFARPEEIAATALMLAGPGGTFYAGACLSPNGGDVMH